MSKKSFFSISLCATALLFLSSCGSTDPGPGVATFKTVRVIPSISTPQAPVKIFPGATSCSSAGRVGVTPVLDIDLPITLNSTVYPGFTAGPNGTVNFHNFTVDFTPTDGGPALSSISGGMATSVLAGASGIASVPVTSATIKSTLQSDPVLLLCTTHDYHYIATINLYGTEVTGANASVQASTTVTYTNLP